MFKILQFLLLPFVVQSTILKLPECGKYDAEFSVGSVDKKVEHGLLLEIQNCSTYECVKRCTFHEMCLSVNYHRTQQTCQLLGVEDMFSFYQVTALGWVHIRTAFKTKIGPVCDSAGDLCSSELQCRDTCLPPNYYECVPFVPKYNLTANHLTVSQSSVYGDWTAAKVIDGDESQSVENSCSHTTMPTNLWWKVIFKDRLNIYKVEIWNRRTVTARLNNADVFVLDTKSGSSETLCGNVGVMENVSNKEITCPTPLIGDGIIIRLPSGVLTLCEVYVYGYKML